MFPGHFLWCIYVVHRPTWASNIHRKWLRVVVTLGVVNIHTRWWLFDYCCWNNKGFYELIKTYGETIFSYYNNSKIVYLPLVTYRHMREWDQYICAISNNVVLVESFFVVVHTFITENLYLFIYYYTNSCIHIHSTHIYECAPSSTHV